MAMITNSASNYKYKNNLQAFLKTIENQPDQKTQEHISAFKITGKAI